MLSLSKITRKNLLQKGWSDEEVEETMFILEEAPLHKNSWIAHFDKIIYWVSLLLGITGNFVMAVVLIPIFLVATPFWLFLLVFLFAFCFGLLFTIILEHIAILQPQHHALNWVVLPVFSFITVAIIASLTSYVEELLFIPVHVQSYWIVALTYTFAFMLPYIIFLHKEKVISRAEKLL